MMYAGFWRRVAATIIDLIILYLFSIVMAVWSTLDPTPLVFMISWFYYAGMESSRLQATIGKICIGIKVTDVDGAPINFGRATGRYFGKILSGLLGLGFIMVAFTAKKQGLHDKMARCLVVNKSPRSVNKSPRSTLFGEYSPEPDRPPT